MSNTALRAEKAKEVIFISDAHEKFYYEKLKEVRLSAPMIKCKKTPKKKCRFMAEKRKKR